jgi:hypothetical protein
VSVLDIRPDFPNLKSVIRARWIISHADRDDMGDVVICTCGFLFRANDSY